MTHPIDFFYQHVGHVLRPYMAVEPAPDSTVCVVCCRPAEAWIVPGERVQFNSYGVMEDHCLACHSLFQPSFELFGTESVRKGGKSVAVKLGMATGCGALITPDDVTLYLNGYFDKMSIAEKPPFKMVRLSGVEAHQTVAANPPAFDQYLYIGNFGRKKLELVANLEFSTPGELVICHDSEPLRIELDVLNALNAASKDLKQSKKNAIKKALRAMYTGTVPVTDDALLKTLTRFANDHPELWSALHKMPANPHERLDLLTLW